jgi:glycosyltransferase involved in cell wall biosynthesis
MRTKPIRILRVIARMNLGGPAYHVSLLSGRLDSRYETLLLAGQVGPGEASAEELAEYYGAKLTTIARLRPDPDVRDDLLAFVALARIVRRFRPQIVHTHTAKAGFLGRLAAAYAVRPRPIIVHTYHGHVLEGYFGRSKTLVYRSLERFAGRRSDALVGVSQATVDDLVRLGVADRSKFNVIPLGLDLSRFLAIERADGQHFRREVDAGSDDVLVTFVGRLVPIKRVDVALRAVAHARGLGAPVRFAVVGDGTLRGELEALAADLGIRGATSFVGYRRDTPEIAAATDVALITSDNEGLPVSLIEAAAAARPAVATAVGGVADVVPPGCGLTAQAGADRDLGEALAKLSVDSDLRRRMGKQAREHVRTRFGIERMLADIDRLYADLLAQRPLVEERRSRRRLAPTLRQ